MMLNSSIRYEEILDDCIVAMQERGQSLEDCLARYPEQRDELEPLLRLAGRLQAAQTVTAPAEFRQVAAVRMQNLIGMQSNTAAVPARERRTWLQPVHWLTRRTATLVASLALVICLLAGAGTISASAQTLPGDTLYPVKRTVENVQLALAPGAAVRARLNLDFAVRRIDEAGRLLGQNRVLQAQQALADYGADLDATLALLDLQAGLTPEERNQVAELISQTQQEHEARLAALLNGAPATIRPDLQQLIDGALARRDRALAVLQRRLGSGGNLPPLLGTRTPQPQSTPVPVMITSTVTLTTSWPTAWPTTLFPTAWPTNTWPTAWSTPGWPANPWPTAWPTGAWPTVWPAIPVTATWEANFPAPGIIATVRANPTVLATLLPTDLPPVIQTAIPVIETRVAGHTPIAPPPDFTPVIPPVLQNTPRPAPQITPPPAATARPRDASTPAPSGTRRPR